MPKSDNPNAKRRLLIQNKKVSILSAINLSFFLHNCMLPTFLSVYFFLTHPPKKKKSETLCIFILILVFEGVEKTERFRQHFEQNNKF